MFENEWWFTTQNEINYGTRLMEGAKKGTVSSSNWNQSWFPWTNAKSYNRQMYICMLKLRYESFLQDPVSLALVLWEGSSCLYSTITPKSATLHLPPSLAGKVWLWHHGSKTFTNTRVGQMQTQSLPPALCNKLRHTKNVYKLHTIMYCYLIMYTVKNA